MDFKKVFILYSERSGSNLLRILLGNHPRLSAPVPPHLYDSFIPYSDRFGDLRKKEHAVRLTNLMKEYVNHPFSNWKISASADDIFTLTEPQNFVGIIDSLYLAKAKQDNKSGYVCKENHLFNYAGMINHNLARVKWIYLHRDPRDVVNSWLKNKMLFFTAYSAANSWSDEQRKCMGLNLAHGFSWSRISYEDMITDTRKHISDVLIYLGLNIHEGCFKNRQSREEATRNVLWKNLDKPIDSSNKKKYKEGLSSSQIEIVETMCHKPMKALGYDFETSCNWKPVYGSYQGLADKLKTKLLKILLKNNETSDLIVDRNKLKRELINSL